MRVRDHKGQSVAEYAVVLALVVVVGTVVLVGIGHRSRGRLANVNAINGGLGGNSGGGSAGDASTAGSGNASGGNQGSGKGNPNQGTGSLQ